MAEESGPRRVAKSSKRRKIAPTTVAKQGVQLAASVRLVRANARQKMSVLLCDGASVQLNAGAAAILSLCDGSRTRAQIVVEMQQQGNGALADDIEAFLDAAETRGWIVDPGAA